jgi:hypothetical protein
LAERGKREGVSLNALAVTMLAESLGERATRERRGVFESKGISRVDIDINESDPVYSLAGQLIGLQLARCVPNRRITAPSIQ